MTGQDIKHNLKITLSSHKGRDFFKEKSSIPYLITDVKSYVPISYCIFEHIITSTKLTSREKLYYLLVDTLSIINKNQGGSRSCALASKHWAKNLNCSRSLIFSMQRSLQEKGYFIIDKDFTAYGLNKRNVIVPTIPQYIFDHLNDNYPDRIEVQNSPYHCLSEDRREYLNRSKLFIRINYHLIKRIISDNLLNNQQKIMWLGFYSKSYKNYMLQKNFNSNNNFSFTTSYQELTSFYSFSYRTISKSVKTLLDLGFIKAANFYIRKDYDCDFSAANYTNDLSNRTDKSLWQIVVSLPTNYVLELDNVKDRKKNETNTNSTTALNNRKVSIPNPTTISDNYHSCTLPSNNDQNHEQKKNEPNGQFNTNHTKSELFSDPTFSKSEPHINKDSKLKNTISNLKGRPKVLFKNFIKRLVKNSNSSISSLTKVKNKKEKLKPFSLVNELIKEKLKLIPREKADKARKFAYRLIEKKLASGYAASLTVNELIKELIYHAATWKPTRLGKLSREKEIDTALTVAWRTIIKGHWQSPLGLVKVAVLDYELKHHKEKYRISGNISPELKKLTLDTEKIVGKWYDLEAKIRAEINFDSNLNRENHFEQLSQPQPFLITKITKELQPMEEKNNQYKNLSNIDLSSLSEEDKYLNISGTGSEVIEITNSNNNQFYGKLKTMEINNDGELVMTLIPRQQKQFSKENNVNNFLECKDNKICSFI